MKILFDHHTPFALAHGGFQQQLEQTRAALDQLGVETDHVRWWDSAQTGDLIHFFGRPPAEYIAFAHGRGRKVVIAELLTATGSRSQLQLASQKYFIAVAKRILPGTFTSRLAWNAYRLADACIALTPWEAHLMGYLFEAPPDRIHVVPNGVEDIFFDRSAVTRGSWLVCTATITARKRILELAEAAVTARTPLWIVGQAYSDADPYAQRFFALARAHPETIRFEGPIAGREALAGIYREARGFVLLSAMESLSLSALEAAACGCPLLLSDLPWARSTFAENAMYCPIASPGRTATILKTFYDTALTRPAPPRPAKWRDVASRLRGVYDRVLSTSR